MSIMKAQLVSAMASGAAAQMNGGPAFLGAFGMGGGFEPPAMLQGMMGSGHGSSDGPTDLVDDIMRRRQQRELQKQSDTSVPPTSLMEVSSHGQLPVPKLQVHDPEPQKRLRGAQPGRRVGAAPAASSLSQMDIHSEEAKMEKHADLRRAHSHSLNTEADTAPATKAQEPILEESSLLQRDCEQVVVVELHVGDSYKVVQHCGGTSMRNLIDLYRNVLPADIEVRILDEDQVEVGHDVSLRSLAVTTETGSKGKLPVLLWMVEDTWDPMPTETEVAAQAGPKAKK